MFGLLLLQVMKRLVAFEGVTVAVKVCVPAMGIAVVVGLKPTPSVGIAGIICIGTEVWPLGTAPQAHSSPFVFMTVLNEVDAATLAQSESLPILSGVI